MTTPHAHFINTWRRPYIKLLCSKTEKIFCVGLVCLWGFLCIDTLTLGLDMEFLEVLTEGLERVLLVRGGGSEVITIYSWLDKLRKPVLEKQQVIQKWGKGAGEACELQRRELKKIHWLQRQSLRLISSLRPFPFSFTLLCHDMGFHSTYIELQKR